MARSKTKVASLVLNNFVNDNRVHKEAKSLADFGFDVTVVALKRGDVKAREELDGFKVHRIKLASDLLPRGKIFGAVRIAELFARAIGQGAKYDILHCNDFEPMLVASLLKRLNPKLRVVYDTHEYAREKNGMGAFHRLLVMTMEPLVIRDADEVITVGDGIADEYRRLYNLDRVYVIYNAPHLAEPKRSEVFRRKLGIGSDKKIFLYQGGLVEGRGVALLIDAFARLKQTNAVMVFMGHGKLTSMVQDAAAGAANIFYHPSVPYDQMMEHTSSADFGIVSTEDVCLNHHFCMPNKLFEYIQAQIPIITTNLHDCAALVQREKIGLVIPEPAAESVAWTVRQALDLDPSRFASGLAAARNKYHWAVEEQKLREIYGRLSES